MLHRFCHLSPLCSVRCQVDIECGIYSGHIFLCSSCQTISGVVSRRVFCRSVFLSRLSLQRILLHATRGLPVLIVYRLGVDRILDLLCSHCHRFFSFRKFLSPHCTRVHIFFLNIFLSKFNRFSSSRFVLARVLRAYGTQICSV